MQTLERQTYLEGKVHRPNLTRDTVGNCQIESELLHLKRLSHTPARDQREKRRKVLFQFPPDRAHHPQNRRLSWPVTPRSLSLPGTESLIRPHCPSDRTLRITTASSQKTVLNHSPARIPFIVHRPRWLRHLSGDAIALRQIDPQSQARGWRLRAGIVDGVNLGGESNMYR